MTRAWSFLSVLLLTACASAPIRPTPPPVPVVTGTVAITLQPPMGGITVHVGPASCLTNGDGVAVCEPVPVGDYRLAFDGISDQYEPAEVSVQVAANQTAAALAAFRRIPIVGHERGFIHVCGFDFCDEDGQPWLLAGYATYTLIADVAHGKDIGPVFEEAASYGANTIVALGMDLGPFARDHGFAVDPRDPQWPRWLATIYDVAAEHHMRVALGVFQQAQALSDAERRRAIEVAGDVSSGRWNVFLRCGNEDDVNGWRHDSPDCTRPPNLGGVLWSTGSRGINNPPTPPNGDFAEWEPPRSPRAKSFSDAGGAGWYMVDGYPDFPAVHVPIVVIEPPFFHDSPRDQYGDERWTSASDALRLGLNIGANFAGGVFGSSQSLEAKPNGPGAAECARQFFRGLKAAFQR